VRILVDSSVLRAGFVSRTGASRLLLHAAFRRRFQPVASTALMLEYEAVLLRDETLAAAGASTQDAHTLLDAFCGVCVPAVTDVLWRPLSSDAGDDLVLEAAINGQADVIATFNLRDIRGPAGRFGIRAETPGVVLSSLA
jgi:predicted nucleic acid-binding protein